MTTQKDKERLRQLAERYAEIVNSEEMNRRREVWRKTNTLTERTVPFLIEDNGTFYDDLMPEFQCEGKMERVWERRFLRTIVHFDNIDDDMIATPYFAVEWAINRPNILPEYKQTHADDGHGGTLGYTTNKPLADLPNSLDKIKRGEFSVDRESTQQRVEVAKNILGDILPVEITNLYTIWAGASMATKAVNWIGMENLFIHMMDNPDSVKEFFDIQATERCDLFDWMKTEGLLKPNSNESCVGSGSMGFTDELPRKKDTPDNELEFSDLWGFQESQEATGISPDMFEEFIFPAQRKVSDRFGLVYYGCCEPVHSLFPVIKGMTNVRKITVSPWCDQESISEQVGKNIVMSRKPHPMKLCGEVWNADEFTQHVNETLTIGKENFVEIIFRDTCTLSGAMKDRVNEACGIMRDLIEKN